MARRKSEPKIPLFPDKIRRLNSPETPWAERLNLIAQLEEAGWKNLSGWPELKWNYTYRGKEWQIPISKKNLKKIDSLEGKAYSDFLAHIVQEWLESHSELKERILTDSKFLHFFVV